MKQRTDLQHAREGDPGPASSHAGAPTAFDRSPRQQRQPARLAQLKGSAEPAPAQGIAQAKGRVALDKIEDPEKRKALEAEIANAREARIAAKQQTRVDWLGKPDGSDDDAYNAAMEKARGDYGRTLWAIKERKKLTPEQFPTGRDWRARRVGNRPTRAARACRRPASGTGNNAAQGKRRKSRT